MKTEELSVCLVQALKSAGKTVATAESCTGGGIGHALMNLAKDEARKNGHRMVMLETQSCNTNAIGFYLHEGFTLIGFDACCYANNDLERKEVRIELGWNPMSSEKED